MLPRHSVPAGLLGRLLVALASGTALEAAVEALRAPFALETFHRLGRRLRRQLDRVRACLCRELAAPASDQPDPLRQTIAHLHAVFPSIGEDAPAGYQLRFQRPFLG